MNVPEKPAARAALCCGKAGVARVEKQSGRRGASADFFANNSAGIGHTG